MIDSHTCVHVSTGICYRFWTRKYVLSFADNIQFLRRKIGAGMAAVQRLGPREVVGGIPWVPEVCLARFPVSVTVSIVNVSYCDPPLVSRPRPTSAGLRPAIHEAGREKPLAPRVLEARREIGNRKSPKPMKLTPTGYRLMVLPLEQWAQNIK